MPECWLIIAMCAVVLVPFINRKSAVLPTVTALIGLGLALVHSVWTSGANQTVFFDSNMLAIDPFSQFFKIILMLFTILVIVQWRLVSRDRIDVKDTPDFLCLLLGAATGMALMASANNLLMIFVAVESASLPSFALAGFRKKNRRSTEGSLKYVLFGAAASAIMVYGMSLVYGSVGSLGLSDITSLAARPEVQDAAGAITQTAGMTPLLAVGLLAMFAGIAFKLSAAPLHFWCPDVFEGAPIEVTTFLSVASKGAAVCLLVRVLAAFGAAGEFAGIAAGVGVLGAVTATWGNLAALHQNNIKRLLAYSSIAHAGYMILGASVLVVAGDKPESGPHHLALTTQGHIAGALLFYLFVYAFMNMGAFTIAAIIARRTGSEDIRDYAGMSRRSPLLAGLLLIFLMSLFGLPPFGGFLGKILIGAAIGHAGGLHSFALLAALFINTLLSLFYYMRPIYYMFLVKDDQDRPTIVPTGMATGLLAGCAMLVIATGLGWMTSRTRSFGQLHLGQSVAAQAPAAPMDAVAPAPAPSDTQARLDSRP